MTTISITKICNILFYYYCHLNYATKSRIYLSLKISKIKVSKIFLKFRLLKVLLIIEGWLPKNTFLLELMLQN